MYPKVCLTVLVNFHQAGQALAPLTIKTSVDREPREMKKNEESI